MAQDQDENTNSNQTEKIKKKYEPPAIETEDLTTYGAACNGTTRGGRKASTIAVPPCNASRINS